MTDSPQLNDMQQHKQDDPMNLQGYQDDFGTGNNSGAEQNPDDTTPTKLTGSPAKELRRELNRIAFDEQESTEPMPENSDGPSDDWREQVQDLDEGDK